MKKGICLVVLIFLLGKCFSQQIASFPLAEKKIMMKEVIAASRHAWKGYVKFARGFDDLKPVSQKGRNWYKESMMMTPIDAYDCFILLGMKKEASEAKSMILSLTNFNLNNEVQLFEVTIRLLGGLISAYESGKDNRFLALAVDLADRLLPAFNSTTGMPYRYVHLQTGKTRDELNNPAEIGTLMLEFGQLSKLTGNKIYYEKAKKAIMEVFHRRSPIDLVGTRIHVNSGEWDNTQSHISGMIDSYYEYLYKAWILFGDKDFLDAWNSHKPAIHKYLLAKQDSGWFYQHVDMNSGNVVNTRYGALDAFYAGLLAYSGDVGTATKVQEGNWYMWGHYNIEPEDFDFKTGQVYDDSYSLRPEILESCFYLFRATKDEKYLRMGKKIIGDIFKHCRVEAGFTSLRSVKTFEKGDYMHSFFFAETLKYAYLLFAPTSALDLNKKVFNTEAHAFSK